MEMKKANQNTQKNKKYTLMAWVMALLVLAVAIPLNLLAEQLDISWDLTPNKLYTLTDATTNLLDSLDKQVDIYLAEPLENIAKDPEVSALYQALLQYDSYDNITLTTFDAEAEPELVHSIDPDGVYNLTDGDFLIKCGDVVKRIPGKMIYQYEYNDAGDVTAAYFRGENYITGAIKTVVEGILPGVYFLTGHGEAGTEGYSRLCTNLANYNYTSADLNLMTADAVPEDCKIVLIAAPTTDITEAEKEKLEAFLDKGGNISFMMSPNEKPVRYKNIEDLMLEYCLAMRYDRVYETDSSQYVSNDPYTFMVNLVSPADEDQPDMTSDLIDSGFPAYMRNCRSLYSVFGSNYAQLTMGTLMVSNNTAVGEIYGGTDEDPEETRGLEMILAAYAMDPTRNDSKIVVFGDASFISDEILSDANQSSPAMVTTFLFLSTITWMYNSDIDMSIADKEKTYDYMLLNSESEANSILYLFGAAPLVVALIGIAVWARRRNS